MSSSSFPRILRKIGRWTLRGIAGLFALILAVIVLVVVAVNLPFGRDFIRVRGNGALADQFVGKLEIDRIGYIGFESVGNVDAHVLDASGRKVLIVRGASLSSPWPSMVLDLIKGRPLSVTLDPVRVNEIEAVMIDDGKGSPTVASAFSPKHPSPSKPNEEPLTLRVPSIDIGHIWVHGGLQSLPVIDTEINALKAAFVNQKSGLDAKLEHAALIARALPERVDPRGTLKADVHMPAAKGQKPSGGVDYTGTLIQAPVTLHAELRGDSVQARFDAPAIPAESLRERAPSLTLQGPTALHVQADGTLPHVTVKGELNNAALRVALNGSADIAETKRATLTIDARDVNANQLIASAPRSDIAAHLKASAVMEANGSLSADYELDVPAGRVNGTPTPVLFSAGTAKRDDRGALHVDGKLRVEEPGAEAKLDYRYASSEGGEQKAHATLAVALANPQRLKAITGLSGRGTINADADVDLTKKQVDARVTAALAPIALPPQRIERLHVEGVATGALDDPELNVSLRAENVHAGSQRLRKVQLSARGPQNRLRVDGRIERGADETIRVHTVVTSKPALVLTETALQLDAHDTEVTVRAERVSAVGSRVDLRGIAIDGAGSARASGTIDKARANLEFSTDELDVGRLMQLAGVESSLHRAVITSRGHIVGPFSRPRGTLDAKIRDIEVQNIKGGSVDLSLALEKRLDGSVSVALGDSNIKATFDDLDLPRPGATRHELANLQGTVMVDGTVDLAKLAPTLRASGMPVERMQGTLSIAMRADNPRSGKTKPALFLRLISHGLRLIEQRPPVEAARTPEKARQVQPLALEGVDGDIAVMFDGATRDSRVDASLFDKQGPLLAVSAQTKLPDLARDDLAAAIKRLPVNVNVRVPERDVDQWPTAVRPKAIKATFSAELNSEGSLLDPRLTAMLALRRLKTRDESRGLDCQVHVKYDRERGEVTAAARSFRGKVLDFMSKWDGDLIGHVQAANATPAQPFSLDADLALDRFPLGVVPQLFERQIHGPLTGHVELRRLGRNPTLAAKFDGSKLKFGQMTVPALHAGLNADSKRFAATLAVTQKQGGLDANVSTPIDWNERLVPTVDPHAKATLKAEQFDLKALSPLVLQYVSDIDGRLDAAFSAELGDGAPKLQGSAKLSDGVLQIPQLGQRLSAMSAKVSVNEGEVRLDSLEADGLEGHLSASASARLNGTDVQSAKARVDIKKSEKFPVTFEGQALGDAWGHAEVAYTHAENVSKIRVDVPNFHMQMPEQSFGSVQDLAPPEHVRIGVFREDGKFAAIPLQPMEAAEPQPPGPVTRTEVQIHLGDSVWIERGEQATVQLSGAITMSSTSAGDKSIDGSIQLRGGTLDVNGKTFHIENGTVSFAGADVSNPTIVATARYDSPLGYTVYAEFSGTIKAGKLTLRAEPQLTQQEILSLLLFGSPEATIGSSGGGGGSAATAFGVAGGTAVKAFNRVVSDFTHLDVSARVDTSTGSARPELVVQVSPRLTTRVTRAIGDPAPGESPDRTFLTLEWRLMRAWSLSGIVGDRGASTLNLLWRRRY